MRPTTRLLAFETSFSFSLRISLSIFWLAPSMAMYISALRCLTTSVFWVR